MSSRFKKTFFDLRTNYAKTLKKIEIINNRPTYYEILLNKKEIVGS